MKLKSAVLGLLLAFYTAFPRVSYGVSFYDTPVCFYPPCKAAANATASGKQYVETRRPEMRQEKPSTSSGNGTEIGAKQRWYEEVKQLFTERGHAPPEPVLRVLAEPTPENVRAYLKWMRMKVALARRAAEAVQQYLRTERERILTGPMRHARILFFHSPTCPHCMRMADVLAAFVRRFPTISITCITTAPRVLKEAEEFCRGTVTGRAGLQLFKEYHVSAVPVLFVYDSSGNFVTRVDGEVGYDVLLNTLVSAFQERGILPRESKPGAGTSLQYHQGGTCSPGGSCGVTRSR